MENQENFNYPNFVKYSSQILSFFIVFTFGLIFIRETQALFHSFIVNGVSYQIIFRYVIQIILLPSIATTVINISQEFTVTEDGIEFQSFVFWRIFVPWEEIVSLKDSYIPWGKYHIVITDRLTLLHRVIGAIYGLTLKPAFIFNNGLNNYDEAVEQILQKLNARQH